MPSWVRYSVAVYVGLLLAGALVTPWVAGRQGWPQTQQRPRQPAAKAGDQTDVPTVKTVQHSEENEK